MGFEFNAHNHLVNTELGARVEELIASSSMLNMVMNAGKCISNYFQLIRGRGDSKKSWYEGPPARQEVGDGFTHSP